MEQLTKRVLHFLPTLEVSSGSTVVVMNYYRHIDRDRVQFDFLYFEDSDTDYISEIEGMGGRVYKIKRPDFSSASIAELDRFFHDHKEEWCALHCHPAYAAVAIGWIAKKNGIRNIIQHSHSSRFGNTKKSSLRNYVISRFNFLIVTNYFACSEDASRLLGWRMFYQNKMRILNNAIHCERFRFDEKKRTDIRAVYKIEPDTVVIGHSGRFSVEKNHQYLIDVFTEYHRRNENSRLMLLGDGEEKEPIIDKIKSKGLEDQVIFLGRKDNPEDYLCAMDFFVFPSFYEGLSLALVEAQCSGLNCYVSDRVDRITKQVDSYYEFSIQEDPASVAAVIPKSIPGNDRLDAYRKIKNSRLNLLNEAKKLEDFYIQLG